MSALHLLLVLDPAEPTHQILAGRLASGLASGEQLRTISWHSWSPGPCRAPGDCGDSSDQPIVLLLAAERWRRRQATAALPPEVLVVAELCGGAARELGSGTALQAPARGEAASRFGVFAFSQDQALPLVSLVQLALPSLVRWRQHQRRCLCSLAEALLWWLRLCEQRRRLLPLAPLAQPVALLPARSAALGARLRSRRRWLQSNLRRRWSSWRHPGAADWQIAIGRLPPDTDRVRIVHRLPPQGRDWFADPFLLEEGPNLWLFCERWQAASGRGVIALFAVRPEGLLPMGTVIEEPFHLSFPRVFQHGGHWWATVESAAAGEVRLYRAESFPTVWRLERLLLSGQAWIDPILLPAEPGGSGAGGWWLLVNSHPLPALPGETSSALQLFHSSDLLHGPFEPHPASPLLLDSSCGRNGGLLQLGSSLIRVGQCTGLNNAYGESVQLRRIEVWDGGSYREAPVQPAWLDDLRRQLQASHLHTLNNQGEWLAVDWRPRAGGRQD